MSDIDKKKLKTVYLRKRKTLTDNEFDRRNAQLFYHITDLLDSIDPKLVHSFLPIEKQREVDTWIIVKYLKAMGKIIVLPKSVNGTPDMEHYIFQTSKQLEKNEWDIWEPKDGVAVKPEEVDMVLVPLVVFDKEGYRIGYGKGYYDKFLSQCRSDCVKIGLSLSAPVDKLQVIEPHDIPLDYGVSPIGVYDFRG